jgi:hypothetical protein
MNKRGVILISIFLLLFLTLTFSTQLALAAGSNQTTTATNNATQVSIVDRQITLPSIFLLLFGVHDETATFARLIVIIGVWLMVFFVLLDITPMIPFFMNKTSQYGASFIITMIMSVSGAFNAFTAFMYNMANAFNWIQTIGPFKIVLALIILIIIFWIIHELSRVFKAGKQLAEAEAIGTEAGAGLKILQTMKETYKELGKK